ncbi:MAG: hypothetical protein ACM3ZQ_10075 [Bacillota bacterium]
MKQRRRLFRGAAQLRPPAGSLQGRVAMRPNDPLRTITAISLRWDYLPKDADQPRRL